MDGKSCFIFFLLVILFELPFNTTFFTSTARETNPNLPSPTPGGGQQDTVGSEISNKSWHSDSLAVSPHFIQMASGDSSQVKDMITIIQGFGWHEVVVLRQDTKYHKQFALSLEDAFKGAKIKIISTMSLSESAKDLEIAEELDKLKAMQTRVLLVYMVPLLRSRVLVLAEAAGIMNERYTWLIMDSLSNNSKSVQHRSLNYGKVVLARRDSPPRLNGRTHFKSECDKLSSWIKSEKATGRVIPVKWKACVPIKDDFTEFVHVDKRKCKLISGFSTEVFCAALQIFPYKVEPEFVPSLNHNCEASQNYNDILKHVGQAYTANLSSIFTIDQLQPEPEVIRSIGYQEGSFVQDLLAKEYETHNVSLKSYTTIHQYHDALMSKSVDVIFDELPYINLFLSKHRSSYMKVGPIYERTGFGFAFPFGSPYVLEFSRAVVNVSESKKMQDLMKKYHVHDYSSDDQASRVSQQSPPLRAHSFIGLFILAAVGTIGAVLASEYALCQRRSPTVEMNSVDEDLPNVDNQEHPPPVFLPIDGQIPKKESDEVEEVEVLPSQEVTRRSP
ncbi:hypothetical protein RJ639_002817 [Escallonia herrerae]|uniref:Ionotropic glutamate receptor C-terminal domain-containing protein n=1 Tax=Escallonia herrerae TaxID=1293975 RepID=A0AA88W0X1_9ASTE|nr:hypothetical protein RJ639_002817 [Escallonia herrerae]